MLRFLWYAFLEYGPRDFARMAWRAFAFALALARAVAQEQRVPSMGTG